MEHSKEYYMRQALKEAMKAKEKDEVPVGAVVVKDGKIIARAYNLRESKKQAYAHAEMLAIMKASKKLDTWCLKDCELYVTLEPCMMCIGALNLSHIHHVYYGTAEPKTGAVESILSYPQIKGMNKHPKVEGGILKEECGRILTEFFRAKRNK